MMHVLGQRLLQTALTGAMLLLVSDPASAAPPSPPLGYHWVPIQNLSDEFNGAQLDRSKWEPFHARGWLGRPPSRFEPQNISVSGGHLILRTTSLVDDLSNIANPSKDIWIGAACVSSINPVASFGYYEVRMRASKLTTTSSFWMKGTQDEIDVVESAGANEQRAKDWSPHSTHASTHFFTKNPDRDKSTTSTIKIRRSASEWHVYGAWWKDEKTVVFFIDGKEVSEQNTAADFKEHLYLYFDTEAFFRNGIPSLAELRNTDKNGMQIDWVHSFLLVRG